MYAIASINGKQYAVEAGKYIDVDQLPHDEGHKLTLDTVHMVTADDGTLHLGAPTLQGATVSATVVGPLKGRKVLVYKMRCKKGYRRKNGHRQRYTRLQIEGINLK